MEILHLVLSLIIPPVAVFSLVIMAPFLAFYRVLQRLWSSFSMEKMRGKVVLITGAASGLGRALALEYASQGARLSLVDSRGDQLRVTAEEAQRKGAVDVMVLTADVGEDKECARLVKETVEKFRGIDHLVHSTSLAQVFQAEETPASDVIRMMDVNFWGNVLPTYYALPSLRKRHGQVVVTASVAGFLPFPRTAVYNAAKAGLLNFYDTLRVELGSEVGITTAAPGWMESELAQFMGTAQGQTERPGKHLPAPYVTACARSIVNAARRKDKYTTVPFWYNVGLFYRVFAPDVLESFLRLMWTTMTPTAKHMKVA